MPLNVDLIESLAHMGAGSGEFSSEDALDGKALIIELKLALIGNHDLKQRLLRDDMFPLWFRDHLYKCVDAFSAADLSAEATQVSTYGVSFSENSNDSRYSEKSAQMYSRSSENSEPTSAAITDLGDAIIVLRLLLAHSDHITTSSMSPPSSSSSISTSSLASMDTCVPVIITLISIFSDKVLQNFATHRGSFLMQILGDTTRALSCFAESSRVAFKNAHVHALWVFLSDLLSEFVQSPERQVTLLPVLLDAYNLLPLLLELEPESAGPFLLQNITYLENQLDVMFPSYIHDLSGKDRGSSYGDLSDIGGFKNSYVLHVVSCVSVAIAQVLNVTKDPVLQESSTEYEYLLSSKFYVGLRLLLFTDSHYVLNVAALNLLQIHLSKLTSGTIDNDRSLSMFEGIFSRIIELLSPGENSPQNVPSHLRLPITILSDLCLKYPNFCAQLKKTGVDKRIMENLAELIDSSPIFAFLHTAKITSNRSKKLSDLTVLRRNSLGQKSETFSAYIAEMSLIASYLLLLSVFTCSNEDFRRRITSFRTSQESKAEPNFLCLALFEIVENYTFLNSQLLVSYKSFLKLQSTPRTESSDRLLTWLGENVTVCLALLEHPLFTNAFYLMRSLSRSVSTLRTFFVDCNSVKSSFAEEVSVVIRNVHLDGKRREKNVIGTISSRYDREAAANIEGNLLYCFLKIISRMHSLEQTMMFFASTKAGSADAQRSTRKALGEKKVVILATLANFILDFSSFRHEIVNHDKFLKDISSILKESIMSRRQCDITQQSNESNDIAFEQLKVQSGILQVIKNYLYNENEDNRRIVWDHISLALIFEFSLYGISVPVEPEAQLHKLRIQQKVLAFEILRNLTAASAHFSEAIHKLYEEFAAADHLNSQHPKSWDSYLLDNILAHDLFVTLPDGTGTASWWSLDNAQMIEHVFGDADYVKLLVAINYLEDHRYTNIHSFLPSHFPKQGLLRVWKRLLGLSFVNAQENMTGGTDMNEWVKRRNHVNEIKISISWILINLTWKDDNDGRHAQDRSDFRLMDIISSRAVGIHRVAVRRDLDRTVENHEGAGLGTRGSLTDSEQSTSNSVMTVIDRARLLYEEGFCSVLENIMAELAVPKFTSDKAKQISVARFDSLNSNDLYEKCKTAQSQILSLISGDQDHQTIQISERRGDYCASHPLRRLSNIANPRDNIHTQREDNRESGNFGDWSDDDHSEPTRSTESEMRDEAAEESEPMIEDEEFDEYWIR